MLTIYVNAYIMKIPNKIYYMTPDTYGNYNIYGKDDDI